MNRPEKLNPLSTQTLRELEDAARWFDQHLDLKVVTVGGRGRAFSAGADLGAFVLLATKAHTNAVTESMVGTGRSWADADGLEAGLRDPEGRAVRQAYLDRKG